MASKPPRNDTVDVRASSIEGLGLFATRSFRAGQRIRRITVVREITAAAPLREELGERADHCDYTHGKVVLIGWPDRHLNHSCDPNAYIVYEGQASFIVARRDVAADDEITCDYNINITGGTAWPCRCGATRCRGTVVGDFFELPPTIQREYRPLLAEWFVDEFGVRAHSGDDGARRAGDERRQSTKGPDERPRAVELSEAPGRREGRRD